jgi:hypothetical protein
MLFIATLKHSPENCPARPENQDASKAIREHIKDMDKLQKETGVKLHGSYVSSNEHTFYFILETDDFAGVRDFLGLDMLTLHTAKITPVVKTTMWTLVR